MKRPGFWIGALVGALLTLTLTAVFSLGQHAAALPFVPFDLFDWTARRLPGALVTRGIEIMVTVISRLGLGPTSEVAKAVEQGLAVAGFLLVGTFAGGILFLVLRRRKGRRPYATGLALGAALAVPLIAVSLAIGHSPAPTVASGAWILVLLLLWGAGLGFSFHRLAASAARAPGTAGPSIEAVDRRAFLIRLGAATAVITVIGAVVGRLSSRGGARETALAGGTLPWSATHPLPNAGADVQPVRGTRSELTPVVQHYRIDINTRPPMVDPQTWRLKVNGLVSRPLELTIEELRAYEQMHQFVTLECISNMLAGDLISTTRWTGVSLQKLLPDLGLRPEATHLRIRSADGFDEVLALDVARADPRVMLCYDWDGLPLPAGHGFPLRIYIPDRFGMKQPKWIVSLEALDHWEAGYWVRRGWDREARVKTTSVIDTVATDMMLPLIENESAIPLGGIAYAGARGVSRVELRVDDGEWRPARLREPLSETSWVLWRYDWPFEEGSHTLTVRCVDGSGDLQTAARSAPHPDGASGHHQTDVML